MTAGFPYILFHLITERVTFFFNYIQKVYLPDEKKGIIQLELISRTYTRTNTRQKYSTVKKKY